MKLNKQLLMSAALLLLCNLTAMAQTEKLTAFPGAEGFGRYVTGGRGGTVYHVTNLNDSGEGSLRWACQQKEKRTIVFDVSGTIRLQSELKLTNGNVTLAGQTAPGDGICVADCPFTISANNVIIRYMRFRLGNNKVDAAAAESGAYDGWDGLGAIDKSNIIIDHCSVSWSIDECLSMSGDANITVQWCLISQSMKQGHSKLSHAYGGNWGGSGASYHHNLLAHHMARTPRLGPRYTTQLDERVDMRNNVIYNWGEGEGCYGGEAMKANLVNNYYKPGPATLAKYAGQPKAKRIFAPGVRNNSYIQKYPDYAPTLHVWGKYYITGNVNSQYEAVTNDNWTNGVFNQIDYSETDGTLTVATRDQIKSDTPIDFYAVTTHSATDAYNKVLQYVGASLHRDQLDDLIVSDTRDGKATCTGFGNLNGIINSQADVKSSVSGDESPWPTLNSTAAQTDTDGDGMPDSWESANGLNPNDATDGSQTASNGYTNLENYLNSLVESITAAQNEGGTEEGEKAMMSEGAEYEISPATHIDGWNFGDITITTDKSYSEGHVTKDFYGIKFSRNTNYTVNLPEGISITSAEITAYCNGDNQTAFLARLGDNTYTSDEHVFEGKVASSHSYTLTTPAKGSMIVRFEGDNQVVAAIKLSGGTSDINTVMNQMLQDGTFYNLQGVRVTNPSKGLYIQNGHKVIIK